ncbi:MAG: YfhO family protein, partial [Armatimonadetes bacterium]|nr:YfhO family protein [Armatimonadota bacterium]
MRKDLAAALALLAVVLLTCLPTLWRAYVHDDFRVYYLPVRAFFAEGLRHGELRWWCSEMGAGFPLFAEGQAGFLHPSTLLAYLCLPHWLTLSLTVMLNLWLGAGGVYACLRQRRVRRLAAVAGGLVYALSGPVLFRAIHLGFFQGLCALPWVLWGMERGFRGARHGWLAAAVALAVVFVAGHPHPTLLALLAVPGYAVVRLLLPHLCSAPAPSPAQAGERRGGGRTVSTSDEPAPLPPPPAPQGEEPERARGVAGLAAAVLLAA